MEAVIMPQVGQDLETAVLVKWLKKPGETVARGEVIAEVESEKATFEVEAEKPGILLKTLLEEGEEGEVFQPIAYMGKEGETPPEEDAKQEPARADTSPKVHKRPIPSPSATGPRPSPAARRLLRENPGMPPPAVGTGPGGRLIAADVREALEDGATPEEDQWLPFTGMRKTIVRRLSESKREAPHFYLTIDVDMTAAKKWAKSAGISLNTIIARSTTLALKRHPALNAHVREDGVTVKSSVHLGMAVSVENGLVVATVRDAGALGLERLHGALKEAIAKARSGRPEGGSTFTITNLGLYGISFFCPVINPPECAILAVGAVEPRVAPVETGEDEYALAVRQMMTLTLAADHRGVNGAEAAQFLSTLKDALEKGEYQ